MRVFWTEESQQLKPHPCSEVNDTDGVLCLEMVLQRERQVKDKRQEREWIINDDRKL